MNRLPLFSSLLACATLTACGSSTTTPPPIPKSPAQALCDAADACLDLAIASRGGIGACIACFTSGVQSGMFSGAGNSTEWCGAPPNQLTISDGNTNAKCVRTPTGNTAVSAIDDPKSGVGELA